MSKYNGLTSDQVENIIRSINTIIHCVSEENDLFLPERNHGFILGLKRAIHYIKQEDRLNG